jgi:gamma-glutamyl hydrolase
VLFVLALEHALAAGTQRPILGVLTQPTDGSMTQFGQSYIAASYVKFLESAGARVVPVFHNSTTAELDVIFASINGILFPGGGSDLNNTPLYKTGHYLYQKALKAFDSGDYFPVFGHCQGFELLAIITSRDFDILSRVDAENLTLPLNFTSEASTSRWLGSASQTVLNILSTESVTMNNHVQCVSPQDYEENEYLPMFYNVLSMNYDRKGKEFISMWEGNKYPIYGAQWHAEKPQFEWNPQEVINHSPDSIFAMQYFANFMVSEARKNSHHFSSGQNEYDSLIYNYRAYYTEDLVHDFEQIYAF